MGWSVLGVMREKIKRRIQGYFLLCTSTLSTERPQRCMFAVLENFRVRGMGGVSSRGLGVMGIEVVVPVPLRMTV